MDEQTAIKACAFFTLNCRFDDAAGFRSEIIDIANQLDHGGVGTIDRGLMPCGIPLS